MVYSVFLVILILLFGQVEGQLVLQDAVLVIVVQGVVAAAWLVEELGFLAKLSRDVGKNIARR